MARPREQNGRWLNTKTTWTLQYRRYDADGSFDWATECIGLKKQIGFREAERRRKLFIAEVNARNCRPTAMMTLSEFWTSRFETQVVRKKKAAGQKHYAYCWRVLEPLVGTWRLSDVSVDEIETVVRLLFERGYSGQSVLHFRNALSALFRHAKRLRLYKDDNPAGLVELGEIRHEKRPTYTRGQLRIVLEALPPLARLMAKLSVATSLGPAEMLGLTLGSVNLTAEVKEVDGLPLAPFALWIRENVYEGKRGSLKRGSRERIIGISPAMADELRTLVAASPRQDPEAPVFQSQRGTPVDTHNISNRIFRKLNLGFPVSWYAFRRAHSTLASAVPGVSLDDRALSMGHADRMMTLRYNVADVDRRRAIAVGIEEQLEPSDKVVPITKKVV